MKTLKDRSMSAGCMAVLLAVAALFMCQEARAGEYEVLYDFDDGIDEHMWPYSGALINDGDVLYGTAEGGLSLR